MNGVYVWFWALMLFGSIAWYGFLLFYVGGKGGWEIVRMINALTDRPDKGQTQREDSTT